MTSRITKTGTPIEVSHHDHIFRHHLAERFTLSDNRGSSPAMRRHITPSVPQHRPMTELQRLTYLIGLQGTNTARKLGRHVASVYPGLTQNPQHYASQPEWKSEFEGSAREFNRFANEEVLPSKRGSSWRVTPRVMIMGDIMCDGHTGALATNHWNGERRESTFPSLVFCI